MFHIILSSNKPGLAQLAEHLTVEVQHICDLVPLESKCRWFDSASPEFFFMGDHKEKYVYI